MAASEKEPSEPPQPRVSKAWSFTHGGVKMQGAFGASSIHVDVCTRSLK